MGKGGQWRPSLQMCSLLLASTLVAGAEHASRQLQQANFAGAPSGSLDASAKQADYSRTVCQFQVLGTTGAGVVNADSLSTSLGGGGSSGPLTAANITCRGSTLNLIGGPLLNPFSPYFEGVTYIQADELPGATLLISDTNMAIENSMFSGLSFFGQGALVLAHSNVTFLNVTFSANNNSAAGAIYANDTSNITVLDSFFENNGGGQGGAIALWNSSLVVNGTEFTGNSGRSAGGAVAVNNGPYVQLTSSTFSGNSAENGGAVFMDSCDRTSISGNTFTQNKANKSGGGIFQNKGSGTLDTNWFTQNRALNGGSVWQNGCRDVVHRNNRFDNNTAERGSAGVEMNQVASIDVSSCTFNGGRGAKGSGLYLQGTQGKVRQCLFQDNVAEYGGAVFRGSTTGNIDGCVFLSNKASKIGGAIYDSHVQGDITGCTFQGNSAQKGKAIFRTVSAGDLNSNKRLDEDTQVTIDNPAST